jgi:hypothetical protein
VSKRRRQILVAVIVAYVVGTIVARMLGYRVGRNTIVRCRAGHVFTTIWIPGVSVKALRLGWWRLQRCPVGNHWTLISPVRESDLTEDERRAAEARHDVRVP